MALTKSVRRVAAVAGAVLDQEDRRILGQGIVISGGVLWIAGMLGLAVRVFLLALGG
jgi:hypothetical protein